MCKAELKYLNLPHYPPKDFVSVGWQLPDGSMERPIPGNRLIAIKPIPQFARYSGAGSGEEKALALSEEGKISVYPNPVESGKQLSITVPGVPLAELSVDIISITGIAVQNEKLSGTGNDIIIDLKSSIPPGIYLIKVSSNKMRWMNKIQVR